MKILKNKKILYIGIPVIVVILAFIICLCLNKYNLELSIKDGTVINLEYGHNEGLPEVTALYKGTIFNRGGTKVKVTSDMEVDVNKLGTYVVTYSAEYKDIKSSF